MIRFIFFLVFISTGLLRAQDFNDSQKATLSGFGIPSEQLYTTDVEFRTDFNSILKLDKKRKRRKVVGIVLGSLGVLSASAGTYGLIQSKDEPIGSALSGLILASGILEIGGSIPLFVSSRRKERDRDKIIKKYTELTGQRDD